MTWSQELIAKLIEVAGEPTKWKLYGEPRHSAEPFATALWIDTDQPALEAAIKTLGKERSDPYSLGHMQIECSSAGWEICVFTDINDAPEGEEGGTK